MKLNRMKYKKGKDYFEKKKERLMDFKDVCDLCERGRIYEYI